jgi:gamma-glutamylputrescine oxidase
MTATATVPLWLDAPYEPRPRLQGDVHADVCVIGGGIGGLSCAARAAEHGLDVVLLEARTVAGGASGRNGGFLLSGTSLFYNDAAARYGRDTARRLYARTLEEQRAVLDLAASLGAADLVRRVGCLRIAVDEAEEAHVREHAAMLREDGFPAEVVEPGAMPAALRRLARAGCLTEGDAALRPAAWVRALATAAAAVGARIHERTPVHGPVPAPGEGPVVAAGGRVTARHVVVACDGALPALVPEYDGRVRARRLHMIGTAPLGERIIDGLVYARWGYEYFQQTADGRVALGGGSDLDGERSYTDREEGDPALWDRLERYLRDDLGVTAPVTHRWVGVVGYSDDVRPYVEEVPGRTGLHVMGGYSGHGNLMGRLAGRAVADRIATGRPTDDAGMFASSSGAPGQPAGAEASKASSRA